MPPARKIPDPRSFLVYSWGKIAKVGQLLNLAVVFEARSIKAGVTPLRATEAAKQLAIWVRRGKISALILIAYRHPFSCRGNNA